MAKVSGLTVANTSRHLQQLRRAGLAGCHKEGLKVFYSPSGNNVIELLDALRGVAERHVADVEKLINTYLTVKDRLEPLPRQEILNRVRNGPITVLDIRPPEEYAAGHVPGAVNVPLSKLEQHIKDLDPKQEVVAYCRGPDCALAFDAVASLRKKAKGTVPGGRLSRVENCRPSRGDQFQLISNECPGWLPLFNEILNEIL